MGKVKQFRPPTRKASKRPSPLLKALATVANLEKENQEIRDRLNKYAELKRRMRQLAEDQRRTDSEKFRAQQEQLARKAKMSTTQKEIAKVYWFSSESNPNRKPYQTLQYTDGSTSCDCKGWTIKRATAGSERSCRHTRDVDAGLAERHAMKFEVYSQPAPRQKYSAPVPRTIPSQGTLTPRPGSRRFNLD